MKIRVHIRTNGGLYENVLRSYLELLRSPSVEFLLYWLLELRCWSIIAIKTNITLLTIQYIFCVSATQLFCDTEILFVILFEWL